MITINFKKIKKKRKELSLDKQNLSDQIIILANEKKGINQLLLFDAIPIENYFFRYFMLI